MDVVTGDGTTDATQTAGAGGGRVGESTRVEAVATDPLPNSPARDLPTMALDTSSVERTGVAAWDVDSFFPHQEWPEVVGLRRGIVMSAGVQPWGGGVMWGRNLDTSTTRTEYRFYAERSSAYAVYWSSPEGLGYNPMSWTMVDANGVPHTLLTAMFLRDTDNDWGIHRRAHLVEIDALAPSSRGNALHFVIRSARVLDATTEYPLVVEDALVQLRHRFDDELSLRERAFARLIGEQREGVPAGYEQRAPDGPTIAAFPTWLDAEGAMEVIFLARYREVHIGPARSEWSRCPPCPCDDRGRCAPCARCMPQERSIQPQVTAGYEMAARYRVTRDGRLVSEAIFAAKPY